jgi:hypothetical protein
VGGTRVPVFLLVLLLAAGVGAACSATVRDEEASGGRMPATDINEVLRLHDDELVAIPGVEGVYVGLLDDNQTPCLKIMVAEKTAALVERLPSSLDGYPVVIEETGVIRPLGAR